MAKVTHKEKYVFKEGQKLRLDDIYDFHGIGNETIGYWWENYGGYADDDIVITRDIEIQITIKVDEDSTE